MGEADGANFELWNVCIENCNSIAKADISLRVGALNIKYGPNGIGKSTIAQALTANADELGDLSSLTPFGHRGLKDAPPPSIDGAEQIQTVMTFDDRYVSQFVFRRDEVLKDSFEVFVNTPEYQEGAARVEGSFASLQATILSDSEFQAAVTSLGDLRAAFSVTKAGAIARTTRGFKALTAAGKLNSLPDELSRFETLLQGTDPGGWVSWTMKGERFLEESDCCPFCSSVLGGEADIRQVWAKFDAPSLKSLVDLKAVVGKLSSYFEPEHYRRLIDLTAAVGEVSPESLGLISMVRSQVDTLLGRLEAIQNLPAVALERGGDLRDELVRLRIDLSSLPALNSSRIAAVTSLVNEEVDKVIDNLDAIRRFAGEQRGLIGRIVQENSKDVNSFLESAGYRYRVKVDESGSSYRMLLEHQDASGHVEAASERLSYGERNAFALVLFMYHVNREQPDLVVLDDPVSSFDKSKKYAIIHQLFNGRNRIASTTLLLTHDIEPAIDIIRVGTKGQFHAVKPSVHFLTARDGRLAEQEVTAGDIKTFSEICDENIKEASVPILSCIHLRRKYDMQGRKGVGYHLLSSLLHLRETPTHRDQDGRDINLTIDEIDSAVVEVRQELPGFDYAGLLVELKTEGMVRRWFDDTVNGYEKVQLFRILAILNPAVLGKK